MFDIDDLEEIVLQREIEGNKVIVLDPTTGYEILVADEPLVHSGLLTYTFATLNHTTNDVDEFMFVPEMTIIRFRC